MYIDVYIHVYINICKFTFSYFYICSCVYMHIHIRCIHIGTFFNGRCRRLAHAPCAGSQAFCACVCVKLRDVRALAQYPPVLEHRPGLEAAWHNSHDPRPTRRASERRAGARRFPWIISRRLLLLFALFAQSAFCSGKMFPSNQFSAFLFAREWEPRPPSKLGSR